MPSKERPPVNGQTEIERAYQQALKYGEDLAWTYKRLEGANQLLNAIFRSVPDGLAVLDESLHIQQVNPSFARLVNRSMEELPGASLESLGLAAALAPVAENLADNPAAHDTTEIPSGSQHERWLLARLARLESAQMHGWVLLLHDLTERKRTQEALRKAHDELEARVQERTTELVEANRELQREIEERKAAEAAEREQRALADALRDSAEALTSTLNLNEVLDRLLHNLGQVIPHDSAAIFLADGQGTAHIVRAAGYEEAFTQDAVSLSVSDTPNLRKMVETGGAVAIPDVPPSRPKTPRTAYAGAPIRLEGEVIGFINLESGSIPCYSQTDLAHLETFADQAAIAIQNARLYEQAQALAVVEERQRLARDLHDAVSQTLWSASLMTDTLPALWEADQAEGRAILHDLNTLVRGALAEMRTLLLELRPETLVERDLSELLRQLVNSIGGRTGIQADVHLEPCTHPLPPDVHVVFYRLAQETLNNMVRHSGADRMVLSFSCNDRQAAMHIQDNGCGYDPSQIPSGHFGVSIMKERAAAIGARLSIDTQPGHGTAVHVIWQTHQTRGGN
jgi:PAS domain S-box-containing protein